MRDNVQNNWNRFISIFNSINVSKSRSTRGHCLSLIILTAQLLIASPLVNSAQEKADTVLSNGYVYTVNKSQALAEAIAISNGRIVYVGNNEGVSDYVSVATKVIDLEGRMVMPGINDGHLHFLALGTTLQCSLDYEALTMVEVRERITICVERSGDAPVDSLLNVFNWAWQKIKPTGATYSKADLDKISTQRPIALRATNTHVTVVNSRALKLAGITVDTADPPGGKIQRDANGIATGVLVDAAQQLVFKFTTPLTSEQTRQAVVSAIKVM
ncbi:MAG: putative amidohydrolase YtcJ, partial [Gammaproteobacteria bacterium]